MTTPYLTESQAEAHSVSLFGVRGTATPLPSERDQNFALTTLKGEKFVLKIANTDETIETLQLQNAVLRYAGARVRSLELPKLITTIDGQDIATIEGVTGASQWVRLLTWLEGEPLASVVPHDDALLGSLGSSLAELDLALADFEDPSMHRELRWDVRHADQALQHLDLLNVEQQQLVLHFMKSHADVPWQTLRHQLIHGDGNDYNILVRNGRVAGLLDFGDMVYSATACDLAVTLAYAMMDKDDPLKTASTIIRAFNKALPLNAEEARSLYALTTARLCLSVCYSAFNAREKSDDPYQQVSARPAWRLLRHLHLMPEKSAQEAFIEACRNP